MMTEKAFIETVVDRLSVYFGKGYHIEIREVLKNNGVILRGMSIKRLFSEQAPFIYLDPYLAEHRHGMTMEEIITDIIGLYRENKNAPLINAKDMQDFSRMRDKVVCKLINRRANEELLKDMPFKPFHDLAVVFYLYLDRNEKGQITANIKKDEMELWGTNVEELYRLSMENTPRLLPSDFKILSELMKEIARANLGDDYDEELIDALLECEKSPLYVLSNPGGIYGAACILYPDMLQDIAEKLETDMLVIIPSSIHETLIAPYDDFMELEELAEMVKIINQTDVPAEDVLSDSIYCYKRSENRVDMLICGDAQESQVSKGE